MSTISVSEQAARTPLLCDGLEALPSSRRFTSEQLEVIYALGYSHITQGQYDRALPILSFLVQHGPTQRHYLYGLGLCLQMQGRLSEAIGMYMLCTLLYPSAYEAMQRIAQCQVESRYYDDALETVRRLLDYARTSGDTHLEGKASGMLAVITHSSKQ